MRFETISYLVWLALGSAVSASIGLHDSHQGVLQMSPSFGNPDKITLHPGRHPEHDHYDLNHLIPDHARSLYYSQESHRNALHGSKHAKMDLVFNHPTVVLDHSRHIKAVKCHPTAKTMQVDWTSRKAFDTAQKSWAKEENPDAPFILVTNHLGCGDEWQGKHSYWRASTPTFNKKLHSVLVNVTPMNEEDAMKEGVIELFTYKDPKRSKRDDPAKGSIVVRNSYKQEDLPSVDIDHNVKGLQTFFDNADIGLKGDITDPVEPKAGMDHDSGDVATARLRKRFLGDWLRGVYDGFKGVIKSVVDAFSFAGRAIFTVVEVIAHVAIISGKLIMVAFGVPFDHSYQHDLEIDRYVEPADGDPIGNSILDLPPGVKINNWGGKASIQCIKCGIKVETSVDARLAFSVKKGITAGHLALVNHSPLEIDMVFGIVMDDLSFEESFRKRLATGNLSPISIPGIFTFGPYVSLSAALRLEFEASGEVVLGGSFSLSEGNARIDLVDKSQSKTTGLDAKFEPIFRANGSVESTIAIGLPVGIECGIDILNGKWTKSVGLFETPEIFLSAKYDTESACSKEHGLELAAGVRIVGEIDAFGAAEVEIHKTDLFKKDLGCVTAHGFVETAVKDDPAVYGNVTPEKELDWINGDTKTRFKDTHPVISEGSRGDQAYRIIADAARVSILVSGEDGNIYLVDRTIENYDVSAPWGTFDKEEDVMTFDVFGRIISYDHSNQNNFVAVQVNVHNSSAMPVTHRATSLKITPWDSQGLPQHRTWLIPVNTTQIDHAPMTKEQQLKAEIKLFPTFCPTANGLRMYGTKYIIDKDGKGEDKNGKKDGKYLSDTVKALTAFGVDNPGKKCRTIRLYTYYHGYI